MARIEPTTVREVIERDSDGYMLLVDQNELKAIEVALGAKIHGPWKEAAADETLSPGCLARAGKRVFDATRAVIDERLAQSRSGARGRFS